MSELAAIVTHLERERDEVSRQRKGSSKHMVVNQNYKEPDPVLKLWLVIVKGWWANKTLRTLMHVQTD